MVDIYGTIGPSCSSQETLTEMFRAGMTGVRLNLSHISLRESAEQIEKLHSAARTAGVNPILLIDMQGPELRIGRLKEALVLREKEKAVLFCEKIKAEELLKYCGEGRPAIPVPEAVCAPLEKEMEVLLDDGRISLKITEGKGDYAEAEVVRGGILTGRKSVKVPGLDIQMPTLTYADIENIRDAASYGVTGIMQPFVRGREDLDTVHRVLSENSGRHLRVVAKIENQAGMERLDSLLPACDAICIARGDLGNDMPLWELPGAQKKISAACRKAKRYFMVATQMLTSMTDCAVPTRAEVNDIFNTVADGASGVMITGESAVGKYPVEAIRFLANTARQGELYRNTGREL